MERQELEAALPKFELLLLKQMFEGHAKCQSSHHLADIEKCSVEVVARKSGCAAAFLICQSSLDWNLAFQAKHGVCTACDGDSQICWKILPV